MLTLFRTKGCPGCSRIQEILENLVIAHEGVMVGSFAEIQKRLPQTKLLPVLEDEGNLVQGNKAILSYPEEVEEFKMLWDKFQSDACYCDGKGNVA